MWEDILIFGLNAFHLLVSHSLGAGGVTGKWEREVLRVSGKEDGKVAC